MIKNTYLGIAENDLAYLTDFYYDARCSGGDFYTVTKEDFEKCLEIMYDSVSKLKSLFYSIALIY